MYLKLTFLIRMKANERRVLHLKTVEIVFLLNVKFLSHSTNYCMVRTLEDTNFA